jgi:hypothetical protein
VIEPFIHHDEPMAATAFEIVHQDQVLGKLTFFDRMIFKGHLTRLHCPGGMKAFLDRQGVLLKDFAGYVKRVTEDLKAHVQQVAADAGAPYQYLGETHTKSRGLSKEDLARQVAERNEVVEGLVCVFSAVEPCSSFDVVGNGGTHRLEVRRRRRKCLHFYLYYLHPELGLCHVRLQSWFPFEVQVWANGREILARALHAAGVGYLRHANAFLKIDDWGRAQKIANRLARKAWPRLLDRLVRPLNPVLATIARAGFGGYYWVADQVEVATDVAFTTRPALEAVLPDLFSHATSAFSSEDVLRFLGRKLHPALAVEVTTDARRRPEGWRVKHRMERNSIKVYDKVSVLRVETTVNNPAQFRVLRVKDGRHQWCPMRKGVANLPRYFQVGQGANERYLDALGSAHDNRAGKTALHRLCRPRTNRGHRHSRFNPVDRHDLALFRAALAGEHAINGFRNKDITHRLHPASTTSHAEAKRRCAATSRKIAKLRGHGLVAKIPNRRIYRVTPYGRQVMSAALAMHDRDFPAAYTAAAATPSSPRANRPPPRRRT